jgi:DNA-binding response OmpR family regulator
MSKKILIVEDEDEFFFFYTMMLDGSDYTVIRAVDGKEAFEILKENTPDLIILDLLLDQMKGEDFLKQLKENPKYSTTPVIIASSFSPRSYKSIFEIDSGLAYLEKPFTQEKLLEVIRSKIG